MWYATVRVQGSKLFLRSLLSVPPKKKKTAPARANANQYKNDFQLANKLRFPLYFTAGMSKWTVDFSFFPFFFFCFSSGSYGGAGQ